jgi:hypothetical protein
VQISRECTPPYLSTGISNLLQSAQAEVVLGQLSRYLASWIYTHTVQLYGDDIRIMALKGDIIIEREEIMAAKL